jgi:hypothetical protein
MSAEFQRVSLNQCIIPEFVRSVSENNPRQNYGRNYNRGVPKMLSATFFNVAYKGTESSIFHNGII